MNIIKDIIWSITIVVLIYSSFVFHKITKGYLFKPQKLLKVLISDKKNDSSIKALFMSLAAKIGVGSIAGVALALYLGGPGTIFWMWVITIVTSITTFVESYLGSKFKGGPSKYIKEGLNNNKLSVLYSIMLIFVYIIGFNSIQINTISKLINFNYCVYPILIGVFISFVTYLIIRKANTYIIEFISKLVPIMMFVYIFISCFILLKNYNQILNILKLIIYSGLNIKSIEIPLYSCIIIGIQRGIFSSEVGTGTGAIAASISNSKNCCKIALIQTIGVMFTTFIICTFTGLIFLMSNYNVKSADFNGIEMAHFSFKYHLGGGGSIMLLIIILLFAFSTIVSGYYFGESNFLMLIKNNKENKLKIFKIFTIFILVLGSIISSSFLWSLADIILAVMTLINMYAIIKLKKHIEEFDAKK